MPVTLRNADILFNDNSVQATAAAVTPPGVITYVAQNTAPTGFLKANGAAISRTTFAALFAAIGTTYGAGDGSTTFALPDLRGEFPRGFDDGRGVDSGRAFGSAQADQMQGHFHVGRGRNDTGTGPTTSVGAPPTTSNNIDMANGNLVQGPSTDNVNGTPRTGAETRPRNVALLACIKF